MVFFEARPQLYVKKHHELVAAVGCEYQVAVDAWIMLE